MRNLLYILLALAVMAFAFWSGIWYVKQKTVTSHSSDLVIENIEKIWKLSTVEARISELYKFKDYYYYDFSPLRKEALVKVNAKVAAGFDFDQVEITFNQEAKEIVFQNFPKPEILTIDHTLEYYDIKQGTFNGFSPEELSKLQQRAKDSIRTAAIDQEILSAAADTKDELIDLITLASKGMGWTVVIEDEAEPVLLD